MNETLEQEYAVLTQAVGMVDDADHGWIEATGPDRQAFVNRFCTNQVARLPPGSGREAFFTDAKGHILAFALIFSQPDSLLLCVARPHVPELIAHLDRYLVRENVAFHDRSQERSGLLLAGPHAAPLLAGEAGLTDAVEYLAHGVTSLRDVPLQCFSLSPGRGGIYLLATPTDHAAKLREVLQAIGVRPCDREAWETLRIELGWPRYGVDITRENLPQEIGRDRLTISFTKGCYLGQETVARLDSRGHVNKLLVGLESAAPSALEAGTELRLGESVVGRVTSAAYSPRVGGNVALGYVRRGQNEPGTRFESPAGLVTVVTLPMR